MDGLPRKGTACGSDKAGNDKYVGLDKGIVVLCMDGGLEWVR